MIIRRQPLEIARTDVTRAELREQLIESWAQVFERELRADLAAEAEASGEASTSARDRSRRNAACERLRGAGLMPFVKIDVGIVDSSLWPDEPGTRVFLTALCMATPYELTTPTPQLAVRTMNETGWIVPPDWYGLVRAAGAGIIRRALLDEETGFTIREVLYRQRYRGVVVWNQTRKRNAWGLERRSLKASTDWITIEVPELRIVSEAQWLAAHGRLEQTRQTYLRGTHGHLWGRPADGHESKYLLTGLSRCASCGGTMIVRSRSHGRRRAFFYACSSFHHRGKTVCANPLEMPLQAAEEAVLTALERELLDPEILEEAATRAAARVASSTEDPRARRHALETALAQAETALARLTEAVTAGGAVATLVQAIREQERRRQTLRAELADLERPRVVPLTVGHLKAMLHTKAGDCYGSTRPSRARWCGSSSKGGSCSRLTGRPAATLSWRRARWRTSSAGSYVHKRWRPQRDSNPCFGLERATSWASGRWGPE
jgi:Recombinase zinc beta ribbon domain/Recombinase